MMTHKTRNNTEKIQIFKRFFCGMRNVYGTYNPVSGKAWQMKAPVTDDVIYKHLKGQQPYGVYLLRQEKTSALAADFDNQDLDPPLKFVAAAQQYGMPAHIEISKSKGYHVWIFFSEEGVLADKARGVANHILQEIGHPNTEIFPKQDRIATKNHFGNFINAPLFGKLVQEGRTVFVKPNLSLEPYPNQWDFLEGIKRLSEADLDQIIEVNDLNKCSIHIAPPHLEDNKKNETTFGIPPCAQKILNKGVQTNQRTTCFRLAVNLRKAAIPYDMTIAVLNTWAQKNKPTGNKRIITLEEILAQASDAYSKEYRACGCEEPIIASHCAPTCPIYSKRQHSG